MAPQAGSPKGLWSIGGRGLLWDSYAWHYIGYTPSCYRWRDIHQGIFTCMLNIPLINSIPEDADSHH